jgi:hypothetical protein
MAMFGINFSWLFYENAKTINFYRTKYKKYKRDKQRLELEEAREIDFGLRPQTNHPIRRHKGLPVAAQLKTLKPGKVKPDVDPVPDEDLSDSEIAEIKKLGFSPGKNPKYFMKSAK